MPHPSENAGAKRATLPDSVPTGTRSLTGVFRLLVEQHQQLLALLRRAEASHKAERRQELWIEIRRQLLSHERGEVLEVYAALEGYDAARTMLERHDREAEELESAMNDVDIADYRSDDWLLKLRDLTALVEDHVDQEETEFFPHAQELLGEASARELEERFVGAQRELMDKLV